MRRNLTMADLGDLVDLRLLAVLATYRSDGTVLLSPVWHEWRDRSFHVVTIHEPAVPAATTSLSAWNRVISGPGTSPTSIPETPQ
jgi:hypothetical protein